LEVHFPDEKAFAEDDMNDLCKKIIDEILKELLKTKKFFKYAVSCLCQQKNGAALNFWSIKYIFNNIGAYFAEDTSDGSVSLPVTDHPYCDLIVTVTGVKIIQK